MVTDETTPTNEPVRLPYKQIIPYVQDQMASDDDGGDKQSIIIQDLYQNATEDQKQIIDYIFAALCGWSLDTIIKEADLIELEEDNDEKNH